MGACPRRAGALSVTRLPPCAYARRLVGYFKELGCSYDTCKREGVEGLVYTARLRVPLSGSFPKPKKRRAKAR